MSSSCIHSNYIPVATLLFVVRYDLIPESCKTLRERLHAEVRWPQPCFFNEASAKPLTELSRILWSDLSCLDAVLRLHTVLTLMRESVSVPETRTDTMMHLFTIFWNAERRWLLDHVMTHFIQPLLTYVLSRFLDQTFQFRSILREIDALGTEYRGDTTVVSGVSLRDASNVAVLVLELLWELEADRMLRDGEKQQQHDPHHPQQRFTFAPSAYITDPQMWTAFRSRWSAVAHPDAAVGVVMRRTPSLVVGATPPPVPTEAIRPLKRSREGKKIVRRSAVVAAGPGERVVERARAARGLVPLPRDIQRLILQCLLPRYLPAVASVCRMWRELCCLENGSSLQRDWKLSRQIRLTYTNFLRDDWGESFLRLTTSNNLQCQSAKATQLSNPDLEENLPLLMGTFPHFLNFAESWISTLIAFVLIRQHREGEPKSVIVREWQRAIPTEPCPLIDSWHSLLVRYVSEQADSQLMARKLSLLQSLWTSPASRMMPSVRPLVALTLPPYPINRYLNLTQLLLSQAALGF